MSKLLHKQAGTIQQLLKKPVLLPISSELETEFRSGIREAEKMAEIFCKDKISVEIDFYRETGEFEYRIYGE